MLGKANKVVYAGAFDPFTVGHLWMVEKASKMFDQLHILVAENIDKDPEFDPDERLEMVRKCVRHIPNAEVHKLSQIKYLTDAIPDGCIPIRGLRNTVDFEYERNINDFNRDAKPDFETIFLIPPPEIAKISSSSVKNLIGYDGWELRVRPYLTRASYGFILKKFGGFYDRFVKLMKDISMGDKASPEMDVGKMFINAVADNKAEADKIYKEMEDEAMHATHDSILKSYSTFNRHYHDMVHIADCLDALDSIDPGRIENKTGLELAIWFHDIVYTPNASTNEEGSALVATEFLKESELTESAIDHVKALILETKNYHSDKKPTDMDHRLIRDIDLIALAAPYEQFLYNQKCIFYEICDTYGKTLKFKKFENNSKKFLRKFLDRKKIYFELTQYEESARSNIRKYIKS